MAIRDRHWTCFSCWRCAVFPAVIFTPYCGRTAHLTDRCFVASFLQCCKPCFTVSVANGRCWSSRKCLTYQALLWLDVVITTNRTCLSISIRSWFAFCLLAIHGSSLRSRSAYSCSHLGVSPRALSYQPHFPACLLSTPMLKLEQALVSKPLRYGTSLSFYDYSYIEATYTVACCIEK
jgi:hypothetical protein